MTADEWQTCGKPTRMLNAVSAKASGRKLRLLACGFCRLVWGHIPDAQLRAAVEAAEGYAEDQVPAADLHRQTDVVRGLMNRLAAEVANPAADPGYGATAVAHGAVLGNPATGADNTLRWADWLVRWVARPRDRAAAVAAFQAAACDLIREIIGPLSHPLVLMPAPMLRDYGGPAAAFRARVTDTARGLAATVADELAFDRLPILADALEDAGLDDRLVLDHLRHAAGHARGCWALDLVLGRA